MLVHDPTKAFRALCKLLNGKHEAALQIFVEALRDMRSFSGLYFILRGIIMASQELSHLQITENTWFICAILFSVVAFVISYVKPY